MDKSAPKKHLCQPLQTNHRHFKKTVTFLTGYSGIFDVTSQNDKFYFAKSITDKDGFTQITIPPGASEMESLNNEIRRINIDEEHSTEAIFPFKIKPNFSTLDSIIESSRQKPLFSFLPNDSIRDNLGLNATIR